MELCSLVICRNHWPSLDHPSEAILRSTATHPSNWGSVGDEVGEVDEVREVREMCEPCG